MGFWRRVLYPEGEPRVEQRAQYSIGDPALAEFFGFQGSTLAGVSVNESTALGLTAVFRAVSIIAGTIAGLPLRALRIDEDGARERVKGTWIDTPAGPTSTMTQFEWVELVMTQLLLHGNAFLARLYNGAGGLVGLQPIPPDVVTVRPIQTAEDLARWGGPDGTFTKWFELRLADGSMQQLAEDELEHIPALNTDGVRGLSPIEVHRQALGTGIAADRSAARLFGSGLLLGGLVSADEDLDHDDALEAVAQLKAKMAGSDHAGDITMINARLKFQPWTLPPVEAQWHESRNYQIEEVSRIFGIPPHLLGLTEKQTSWGTGVSEQNRGFARYTLMAWTTRIEQHLTRLLSRPVSAEFDYAGLLQPAPEVEIPLLISQVQAGLLTVDEARRIRNMPPLPAGTAPPPDASSEIPAGAGAP